MNPHFPSPHQGTCCEKCFESMTHAWLFGHKKRHQVALQCLACQWWNKPRFQRLPSYTNQQLPTNLSCIMSFFWSTAIISCHLNKCQSIWNIMAWCLNLESWYFQAWKEQDTSTATQHPHIPSPHECISPNSYRARECSEWHYQNPLNSKGC